MCRRTGAIQREKGTLAILCLLLILILWGALAHADPAQLPAQTVPLLKSEPVSLGRELTAQPELIIPIPLTLEIPVKGECTGRLIDRIDDKRVELCAEYSIEVSDQVEAMLIELWLGEGDRNVHIGFVSDRPVSRSRRFFVNAGEGQRFGEPVKYRSVITGISRSKEDGLKTGIWFIAVFNFEQRPQQYRLTVELTPVELISDRAHEGSIVDNAVGGRKDPDGLLGFVDYFIEVTAGAGALLVRLENDEPANDINLFVRFGEPVDVTEVGEEKRVLADCPSVEPGGIEFCTITPLQAGRYYIKVSNHEPKRQYFTLTATVVSEPLIKVSPDRLEFRAQEGGPNPVPQTLQITNAGGGTLEWEAKPDVPWLALEPVSGALAAMQAQTVNVAVNISGLEAGTHEGHITITAPGATNSPVTVPVTLELTPRPALWVHPEELLFEARVDGPNPEPQALEITNVGGGILAWSASADVPWLQIEPARGVLAAGRAQTASVSVDITGLATGKHEGQIVVEAPGATNSPVMVKVTLELRPPGQVLALKFEKLEFLRPQDWERRLQEGCVIYKNIGVEPSPIRVTLPDQTVLEFQIPAGNEVIVCDDVVHIDTRVPPREG